MYPYLPYIYSLWCVIRSLTTAWIVTEIQALSRNFLTKFQNFQSPNPFSRTSKGLENWGWGGGIQGPSRTSGHLPTVFFPCKFKCCLYKFPSNMARRFNKIFPFSALTLLVGRQEGIWPVNSWMVCWWWQFGWSYARLIAPVVSHHHFHHP